MGVGGADIDRPPMGIVVVISWLVLAVDDTGKASQVDVTRTDLSTALRYFPSFL